MLEEYNITKTTLKIISLYRNDYTKSLHLREIARETNTDVKTIHIQLKKLEAINILSSQIRGKNKEHTLNQKNITTKYFLNMAEIFAAATHIQNNFVLKKIISELDPKISDPIVLFGSFANNTNTKQSDVDLFFITEKKIDKKLISETADLVNRDINIKTASEQQLLNGLRKKDPLVSEAISNHIVLKGADRICDVLWQYYANK